MKIYSYFICRIWHEEKKSFEIKKIKLSNEVMEHPGAYTQTDNKEFYTNWSGDEKHSNFLAKSSIGKVERHIYGTNVVYGTYLTKDDEQKAFDIIAVECKKDIEELHQKLEEWKNIYNVICSGSINK
ncbi:MAG: hypothetical protein ACI4GD_08955 [Lachnospiraceae bacterium]